MGRPVFQVVLAQPLTLPPASGDGDYGPTRPEVGPWGVEGDLWRSEALCIDYDQDIFFPAPGHSAAKARQICAACPVSEPCLEYALASGQSEGIWAGISPKNRRQRRKT